MSIIRLGTYAGYDEDSGSVIPMQRGDINYTAILNTSGYNEDTQKVDEIDYPLTVGDSNNITLLTENTLKITANSGFTIKSFTVWITDATPIVTPVNSFEYVMKKEDAKYNGMIGYLIETEESNPEPLPLPTVTKQVLMGNAKVYNEDTQRVDLVQNVAIEYTAEVYTTQYNPDTQLVEEYTYPVVAGVLTEVKLLSETVLRLRANADKRFNQFTLDYDESNPIPMPKNEIDYTFNSDLNIPARTQLKFIINTEDGGIVPPDEGGIKTEYNYLLTPEEYQTFKSELYSIVAGEGLSGEGVNPTKFPTNTYVTSTKLYPFPIPDNELSESVKIIAKETVMNAKGTSIKGNVITLDLGVIEIARVFNNALDYLNVTGELFLPFYTGSIDLDINLMMGKSINIQLETIVNSGDTTINIIDANTGTILNVIKSLVGGDFPLFNAVEQDGIVFTPQQAINSIKTAYVLLSVPDYSQGMPKAVKTDNLLGVTGDVSATDIKLETDAYADEKLMIENLLSQGILIK